jgi:hypothetical protein
MSFHATRYDRETVMCPRGFKPRFAFALLFLAASAGGQTAPEPEEKEAAIVEVGAATSWNLS